jgi:ligand-binding sensor domain-containing protein/DNA-binding CsgD family transcriptional regulator
MKTFLLVTACLLTLMGAAQNTIGLPDITNYYKGAYHAGHQNRQVIQDRAGIMYFANNDGLLTFDGQYWKTYPLPNKSIVRSLAFGPDGKLYAGGQDEFGYFSPAKNGQLEYHSLKSLLPQSDRSCTDVWAIYSHRGKLFFQTSEKIYEISGQHCSVYKNTHWLFLGQNDSQLIAQDYPRGLLQYRDGVWAPFLTQSDLPATTLVTSLTPIGKDSALLTTLKDGIYILNGTTLTRLHSPFLESLNGRHITSSALVNRDHIALGTNGDGCFIINLEGTLVQSFSRTEGLQNNNVLDVFLDKEKNLWAALDNGIDFIAYNNAIKHIYPDNQNEGSGYAARIWNNELYVGTSNGLYRVPVQGDGDLSYLKGRFQPVNNTRGQVWNLSEVNGQLLLGHHEGAFAISGGAARPIDGRTGFWGFLPYSSVLPSSLVVSGTYQGLTFYNYASGQLSPTGISAPFESARFLLIDNESIWASHPYKGIYRVTPTTGGRWAVKQYGVKQGILSVNNNYIFRVSNRVLLTTEKGIYEYNAQKDLFEPSAYFNRLFPGKALRYLKEDASGNIWFVHDKLLGIVVNTGDKPEIIYLPELTDKFVSGFEFVYPVNNSNIFIGGEKGFYHLNFEKYKKNKCPLLVQIRTIKAAGDRDSLLFGGYTGEVNDTTFRTKPPRAEIGHAWNSFHFDYSATAYGQQANIEYSIYLEGFDDKWSEWSRKTEKEYTKLWPGTYTFHVKARNNLGDESKVSSFTFTVLPPWYLTYWAYALYLIVFGAALYGLNRLQKRKYEEKLRQAEEEQKRLQYLHQLEMEKSEKEIIKLRNEKLEAEIHHKNKELASAAMHLVQKGELFTKVKDELLKLKKTSPVEKGTDDFKKLIRIISEEDRTEEDWEHFALHFDKVHSDFLVALKEHFPKLSPNELKLCAYLRMNLSTKEIAQLMNISVRGVEISRYRLRKKLQIPTETNLFEYLLHFQNTASKEGLDVGG